MEIEGPEKIHPGKLTWNLKITQLKRKIIFQTSIFGFHVNFSGVCLKHQLVTLKSSLEISAIEIGTSKGCRSDVVSEFQ